jgi:hypothetical protein
MTEFGPACDQKKIPVSILLFQFHPDLNGCKYPFHWFLEIVADRDSNFKIHKSLSNQYCKVITESNSSRLEAISVAPSVVFIKLPLHLDS